MPDKVDPYRAPMEFDEHSPEYQVRILAFRVDVLTKEKEEIEVVARELEKRVSKMEKSFQRGAGALIVLPVIGTFIGFVFAYGKILFGAGGK